MYVVQAIGRAVPRNAGSSRHLLRRTGFSASEAETNALVGLSDADIVERLINYDPAATNVDNKIRTPGYVGITATTEFAPNTNIQFARQRWLFRMVHSPAPLQEKMALFWHNHFATGYSKVAGTVGPADGARLMDAKPSEDVNGQRGQIQLFRDLALGNFTTLLTEVAKDPAMLIWLDGRTNTKSQPQENFAREVMELFTFGVANYVESDVYAGARVFTGWNLATPQRNGAASYAFNYNANQHETSAKTFSFPIYADGNHTIPARAAAGGMQDGVDLITALAKHPETARRLARKLWAFFVSELRDPDPAFVDAIAGTYLSNNTEMKPVVKAVLTSPQFADQASHYQRYSWPAEYVVRSLKEIGFLGFSVNDALTPLTNMGQTLYEPPDVSGWDLGTSWFSTAGMLARMNFASQVAANQKFNLRDAARPFKASPDGVLKSMALSMLSMPVPDADTIATLTSYMAAGGAWTGSDAQLANKTSGVIHLLAGSGDYQFV
jgi:uncharacterized protein (DUF1800 family)